MFNGLSHDWKVSKALIVSFLLSLPDHYFSIIVIKTINIALLNTKFELILGGQNFNQLDDIVHIDDKKVRLCLMLSIIYILVLYSKS